MDLLTVATSRADTIQKAMRTGESRFAVEVQWDAQNPLHQDFVPTRITVSQLRLQRKRLWHACFEEKIAYAEYAFPVIDTVRLDLGVNLRKARSQPVPEHVRLRNRPVFEAWSSSADVI